MYRSLSLLFLVSALPLWAQNDQPLGVPPLRLPPPAEDFLSNRPSSVPTSLSGYEYRVGRDDLVDVTVFEVPSLGGTGRVSATGVISLPLIGVIQAAGKTSNEIERAVEDALRERYVNDPHVTVFVREYGSQPVSIIGAVRVPGIYQIKGQKYLLDMLAMVQGVDASAGKTIQVIRRDPESGETSKTITVNIDELLENGKTELNMPILAGDVINVVPAGSVFVVGEVVSPGEFPLKRGKNITATQAVALSSGFTKEAKKKECLIIRVHRDGSKEEIPVNVGKILEGSLNDVTLLPDDILFVPANKVKTGLLRAMESTIAIVSGRLVYR